MNKDLEKFLYDMTEVLKHMQECSDNLDRRVRFLEEAMTKILTLAIDKIQEQEGKDE